MLNHVLHTLIVLNQLENHMYHTISKQYHLFKKKTKHLTFQKKNYLPGNVLVFPNDVIVLLSKRCPRVNVRKNCCSSSLIISLTN